MNAKNIVVKELVKKTLTEGKQEKIKISVSYNEGSYNRKKGFYLHVQPITVSNERGYTCTSFMGFSGSAMFLKEIKRFSRKQYEAEANSITEADYKHMLQNVTERNKIDLNEYE